LSRNPTRLFSFFSDSHVADDIHTAELRDLLARSDRAARDELLRRVQENLRRLAHNLLRSYPSVVRWEATDDVLNGAMLRLLRALEEVTPETPRQFFGLAATVIRRELLDLARHYYGPRGQGANHASHGGTFEAAAPSDSIDLDQWREFHERVTQLPADEREIVDLLHYQGMPPADAAALLGVDLRTVQRRWQNARLRLHALVNGPPAEHPSS
jgi:RNA polymerase sigma-70 factor (ECF subfamily)